MTFLVEGEPQEAVAFMQRYRAPTVEQIDPSFIHMHPAVMERSDFEALEEYSEPVEPRVIDAFDYRRQAELTAELAAEFVDTITNRLDRQETVHDRVFEIMRAKRFRAGTVTQTRFEDNRELFDFVEERLRPVFAEWWRANPDDLRRASLISAAAANRQHGGVGDPRPRPDGDQGRRAGPRRPESPGRPWRRWPRSGSWCEAAGPGERVCGGAGVRAGGARQGPRPAAPHIRVVALLDSGAGVASA